MYIYICIYIYVYTCICRDTYTCIYIRTCIYIYVCIRQRALRAWCDRACQLCFPTFAILLFLLFSLIGPPLIRTGITPIRTAESCLPCGALCKLWFLIHVLANIHYCALWIHHIIHTNLICCLSLTCCSLFHFPAKASYSHDLSKTSHKKQKQSY